MLGGGFEQLAIKRQMDDDGVWVGEGVDDGVEVEFARFFIERPNLITDL